MRIHPKAKDPTRGAGAHRTGHAVPRQFLELLGKRDIGDLRLGDNVERNITVMFSDIRDFTALSESMTPRENFRFINRYLGAMEPVLFGSRGFIDKYIGDAMMALFPGGADDALRAAVGILKRLREFNSQAHPGSSPIRIGIGLNSGVMMVGTVGSRHWMETTVIGDAVNLASRLEFMSKSYGVPLLISEHVYFGLRRPAGHDIRFIDRVRVRGKGQPQSVYEVFDADSRPVRLAKRQSKEVFEEALACYHLRDIRKAQRLLRECLKSCPEDRPAQLYAERCREYLRSGVHEGTGETEMRIAWGPEFELGHPLIDQQHQELFSRVNEFADAMRTCRAGSPADRLIDFLREYVEKHFRTEEKCMEATDYPLLDLQREQHARFSREFSRLAADIRSNIDMQRRFLQFRIQVFVIDWIVNHTIKLDRHFGKYLRQRKAGRRVSRRQGR